MNANIDEANAAHEALRAKAFGAAVDGVAGAVGDFSPAAGPPIEIAQAEAAVHGSTVGFW